jgi:lipoprotein-anchoring transpeptidase ErfK/SrfK
LPRRVRSLLSVPLLLLAIVGVTVFTAPPAFSAVLPAPSSVAAVAVSTSGAADSALSGGGPTSTASLPADAQKGYYVRVGLDEQLVRVYLDGREIRSMICSGGTAEKPTPVGRFYIQNRGDFFFSEKYQQGGKWWVSFRDWGIYLFHSVPTNRLGDIIPEEAAKLGQPASHGCIRLSMDDAKWFYDTIPAEAPVDIGS